MIEDIVFIVVMTGFHVAVFVLLWSVDWLTITVNFAYTWHLFIRVSFQRLHLSIGVNTGGTGGTRPPPPEFVVGGRQCYSSPQILASWTMLC